MSGPKQAAVLLFAAERDFDAIRRMLDPGFYDEVFGQHVQQAVEKFLKAWLCLLGEQYPFRHDLQELMGRLEEQGILVEDFTALVQYTPYASELRYLDKKSSRLSVRKRCSLWRNCAIVCAASGKKRRGLLCH